MIKQALVALLVVAAALAVAAHRPGSAALLAVVAALNTAIKTPCYLDHRQKQRWNRLAAWLVRGEVALAAAVALAALSLPDARSGALLFGLSLGICGLPGSLLPALWHSRRPPRKHAAAIDWLGLRVVAGLGATLAVIVLISAYLQPTEHILPALTLPQLILSTFFVPLLPLAALGWDKTHRGEQVLPLLSLRHWQGQLERFARQLGFPLLIALLTYANYLLFFMRYHLSPGYIEASLPLYRQATSLALLTLALCWYIHALFERARTHRHFVTEHLLHNKKLLKALGASLALILLAIYLPPLQKLFNTAALGPIDWLTALACTALYKAVRLTQRQTRLHSRRAVLQLHRQIRKV